MSLIGKLELEREPEFRRISNSDQYLSFAGKDEYRGKTVVAYFRRLHSRCLTFGIVVSSKLHSTSSRTPIFCVMQVERQISEEYQHR